MSVMLRATCSYDVHYSPFFTISGCYLIWVVISHNFEAMDLHDVDSGLTNRDYYNQAVQQQNLTGKFYTAQVNNISGILPDRPYLTQYDEIPEVTWLLSVSPTTVIIWKLVIINHKCKEKLFPKLFAQIHSQPSHKHVFHQSLLLVQEFNFITCRVHTAHMKETTQTTHMLGLNVRRNTVTVCIGLLWRLMTLWK